MDQAALIDEIIARVAAKLTEAAGAGAAAAAAAPVETVGRISPDRQPCLVAVTEKNDERVFQVLTDQRLLDYYRTTSASGGECHVDMDNVGVLVLYDLTLCNMVKIAEGSCDTPYTRLVREAILSGRKIFVPEEEVMLLRYEATSPMPYFNMLKRKLDFLKACGVVVCPERELTDRILEGGVCRCAPLPAASCCTPVPFGGAAAEAPCVPEPEPQPEPEKIAVSISKRVIHERDILDAAGKKATEIHLPEKCILTDLAKDAAKRMKIALVRE